MRIVRCCNTLFYVNIFVHNYQLCTLRLQIGVVYTMTLTAIKYDKEGHVLSLLDQRSLPTQTVYISCATSNQVNWELKDYWKGRKEIRT